MDDLSIIPSLSEGAHASLRDGACIMEAVSYVAGEPWSDHPGCVSPVIAAFLRAWNDGLPDDERDALLRPLIPLVIGTIASVAVEQRRATMAADWLLCEHTSAWPPTVFAIWKQSNIEPNCGNSKCMTGQTCS